MPTRNELLLAPVLRTANIIEIGPSYSPIAPKIEGWKTRTLDHTTRDGLIAKYRGHPGVDVNRIEEVDFVWTCGSLIDAVPPSLYGTFDAFIASHVIEHTPDLIAFLDAANVLLKLDGVVILAIPDKRYCFDYFQPRTTTGQVLAAHAERRSNHSRRLCFDHVAYAVKNGGEIAWGQHPSRGFSFVHAIEDAHNLFVSVDKREDYVDIHAWRFTPASFELMLLELAWLGETEWRAERVTPADRYEFFAWLRHGGTGVGSLTQAEFSGKRLDLLKRTLLETQEQISWLLAGEPGLVPSSPPDETDLSTEDATERLSLKHSYQKWVNHWKQSVPLEEAMHQAVGGNFDVVGGIECALLKHYGLPRDGYLIDVGCGSGRLAKPLSAYLSGRYLGFDLVSDLVDYARQITSRSDWRFEVIDHIEIPERDGQADMVCFFSVLTHLLHEQSFWYLEEAKRVLKPGGKIVFSFLEFHQAEHWKIFLSTVQQARLGKRQPLNVFIDRDTIRIWAQHLGLRVEEIRGAPDAVVPQGALGQSLCVLSVS